MRRRELISMVGGGLTTAIAGCGETSNEETDTGAPESTEADTESGTPSPETGMATQEEQFDSYPHQEALTFEQKRWLDNFETNYDGFTDYRGQGTVTITQGVGESNIYFDEPAVWIDVGQKVRFTLADDVDESEDWQVGEAMETTDKFLVDPVEGGEFSHTFESEGVYMYQNGYNVRDGAFGFIVVGRPA